MHSKDGAMAQNSPAIEPKRKNQEADINYASPQPFTQMEAADHEYTQRSAETANAPHQEPLIPTVTATPTSEHTSRRFHIRKASAAMSSSWWWWEIFGAFITLTCLFMTIAVLAVLDNKSTDDWHHKIQPSAILAILTAVGKMGLTLVVASCVSQLKWVHFQKPNSLSHLDVFDNVSRAGPWSTALMVLKIRKGIWKRTSDFMIALFALITLGAIAIDPMIQQILGTPQREIQLHDITASIMSNRNYVSRAVSEEDTMSSKNNAQREFFHATARLLLTRHKISEWNPTTRPKHRFPRPIDERHYQSRRGLSIPQHSLRL